MVSVTDGRNGTKFETEVLTTTPHRSVTVMGSYIYSNQCPQQHNLQISQFLVFFFFQERHPRCVFYNQ